MALVYQRLADSLGTDGAEVALGQMAPCRQHQILH